MTFQLIIFLCVNIASAKVWEPKVKSIDVLEQVISNELKLLISEHSPQIEQKLPIIQHLRLNQIEGDKNSFIVLDYLLSNGDIGTHNLKMLLAVNKAKGLSIIPSKSVSLRLKNSPNVILSNPSEFASSFESEDPLINCTFNVSDVSYSIKTIPNSIDSSSLKKTIRFKQWSFGLHSNAIKLIVYDGNAISLVDISHYEVNSTSLPGSSIEDFYIIDQLAIRDKYLVALANESLLMFTLSSSTSIKLTHYKTLKPPLKGTIQKVGLNGSYLIVCFKDQGLIMLSMTDSRDYVAIGVSVEEKKVDDFIIAEDSLFSLVKGKGIFVYSLRQLTALPLLIQHSKINQIDDYIHPFYGSHYLGVSFDQRNGGGEFFLELIINTDPKINSRLIPNKVLTSSGTAQSFLPFYSFDNFNTYFYSNKTKSLYIIRRGLSPQVDFITYRIPLKDYPTAKSLMSLHHNQTSLLLLQTDTSFLLFDTLSYSNNSLSCSFKESGSYLLRFVQKTDACSASLQPNSIGSSYCQKSVNVNFNIYQEPDQLALKLAISFAAVVLSIFFAVIAMIAAKLTHCFKKNTLKLIPIDKNSRDIYLISDSILSDSKHIAADLPRKNEVFNQSQFSSERGVIDYYRSSFANGLNYSTTSRNVCLMNSQSSKGLPSKRNSLALN